MKYNEKLGRRAVDIWSNWDHYSFMDSVEVWETVDEKKAEYTAAPLADHLAMLQDLRAAMIDGDDDTAEIDALIAEIQAAMTA